MRPARLLKLADWIDRQAEEAAGTAKVLANTGSGDPDKTATQARLFAEAAEALRAAAARLEKEEHEA